MQIQHITFASFGTTKSTCAAAYVPWTLLLCVVLLSLASAVRCWSAIVTLVQAWPLLSAFALDSASAAFLYALFLLIPAIVCLLIPVPALQQATDVFFGDPCFQQLKRLVVQAACV